MKKGQRTTLVNYFMNKNEVSTTINFTSLNNKTHKT